MFKHSLDSLAKQLVYAYYVLNLYTKKYININNISSAEQTESCCLKHTRTRPNWVLLGTFWNGHGLGMF